MAIKLEDISGKYMSLGLLGPKTEELLNVLLPPPYKTKDIECGTCQVIYDNLLWNILCTAFTVAFSLFDILTIGDSILCELELYSGPGHDIY